MKAAARYFRLDSQPLVSVLGGRLFRKEVLRAGDWIHPLTKQQVEFSRADLSAIAAETNRLIAAGVKVPFPDGHDTSKAANNLGFWQAFSVEGDRLFGVCEAADDKVAQALGTKMRDVSIYLESEVVDSHGAKFSNAITHVCATQYPVIENQGNFIQLSRNGAEAPVPVLRLASSQEKKMALNAHLVAIAASLALSTDGIADDAALEKKITEHTNKTATEKEAALAASKTAATALSTKESESTALASRVTALEAERKARDDSDRRAEIKATAEACVKRPEAFSADRQAKVEALWPKDRDAAREIMALARESAGASVALPEGTKPAPKPADKASAEQKALDRLDTIASLARNAGHAPVFSLDRKKLTVTARDGKVHEYSA